MGQRNKNFTDPEGRDRLPGFAEQDKLGLSIISIPYFDLVESGILRPTCSDRLKKGFFGGKAGGIVFELIRFGLAIINFIF